MKRLILFLFTITLAISCVACAGNTDTQPSFYYLRTDDTIVYGKPDALIAPVPQELSEIMKLDDILQLYLDGPAEELYRNPFPQGTILQSTIQTDDLLVLVLSPEFSTLDGIQLTLAGACLCATCRELTGADRIQILSGEQVYDFDYYDFIFLDDSAGK